MGISQNPEKSLARNAAMGSGVVPTYGRASGNKLLYFIVAIATCGFSLFGYDQGLMSGIIASRQFNREFPATNQNGPDDVHGGTVQGSVTSCYEVGCFFGAMIAYFVGERMGRRRMMLSGAVVMIIGTVIQCASFGPGDLSGRGNVGGFVQFIIGRVITGVGNGANTATIPSWVAETSKAHNRGFLICVEASTVAVGTAVAYWIDFGFSFLDSSVSWRFPTAFQIVFAFILMGGVLVLPESPRWLFAHGYDEEGLRVVAALNATPIDDPATLVEKNRISDAISAQAGLAAHRNRDILKGGKQQHLRRALVGASTQLFQQLGGCNAVIYYSTILFENQILLETQLSLILGGVLSVIYAMFALTSFFLVERVGRRKLFLIGTFGQGASMFITWACLLAGSKAATDAYRAQVGKGAAVGLFLFISFFGATWLPLPWLYPAELNSMAVRTQANAISTMTNWLSNFLVVQVLPTMTASIGSWTFFLFAMANVIFLPIIYLYYPETAGRTLEELDVVFAHAHLTKRRPTIIAKELPMLTEHQISTMTERYDIHGGAADMENGDTLGAPTNETHEGDANIDTTLPPAEKGRHDSADENLTRVPSPAEAHNGAHNGFTKTKNI